MYIHKCTLSQPNLNTGKGLNRKLPRQIPDSKPGCKLVPGWELPTQQYGIKSSSLIKLCLRYHIQFVPPYDIPHHFQFVQALSRYTAIYRNVNESSLPKNKPHTPPPSVTDLGYAHTSRMCLEVYLCDWKSFVNGAQIVKLRQQNYQSGGRQCAPKYLLN